MIFDFYISDLLYRYDCVIVPNFGGFVSRRIGATRRGDNLKPPYKQLTFNCYLKEDDGLLANRIANSKDCSYEQAVQIIEAQVGLWNNRLKKQPIFIRGVGVLRSMPSGYLEFTPQARINYLMDSFGFDDVLLPEKEHHQQLIPLLRYAAFFAIALGLGIIGQQDKGTAYPENRATVFSEQSFRVEKPKTTAPKATVLKPTKTAPAEPTKSTARQGIAPPIVTKKATTKTIIIGSFRKLSNANKAQKKAEKLGYQTKILHDKKWHLVAVLINDSLAEALKEIRERLNKGAWSL